MFYNCKSLSSLPDISQWNTESLKKYEDMFYECSKKLNIPDKFKD